MEPRLATSVLVGALIRRAEQEGGFAAVLARGDATSGAMLLILAEKGRRCRYLERALDRADRYVWRDATGQVIEKEEELREFLQRRRKIDPDLWVLELDVPSAERFTAILDE